jgi:hypothetical protein
MYDWLNELIQIASVACGRLLKSHSIKRATAKIDARGYWPDRLPDAADP